MVDESGDLSSLSNAATLSAIGFRPNRRVDYTQFATPEEREHIRQMELKENSEQVAVRNKKRRRVDVDTTSNPIPNFEKYTINNQSITLPLDSPLFYKNMQEKIGQIQHLEDEIRELRKNAQLASDAMTDTKTPLDTSTSDIILEKSRQLDLLRREYMRLGVEENRLRERGLLKLGDAQPLQAQSVKVPAKAQPLPQNSSQAPSTSGDVDMTSPARSSTTDRTPPRANALAQMLNSVTTNYNKLGTNNPSSAREPVKPQNATTDKPQQQQPAATPINYLQNLLPKPPQPAPPGPPPPPMPAPAPQAPAPDPKKTLRNR